MAPVVVKFVDKYGNNPREQSKDDKKVLKSDRPISLSVLEEKRKTAEKQLLKNAKSKADQEDIKNDLALDRLISESHILATHQQYSGAELTLQTLDHENPTGNARVRALDSRIQKLASVNGKGVTKLEKMPMNMRKGMIKSRLQQVEKYEKEAKDAGIILAKKKKGEFRDIGNSKGATSISSRIGTGIKSTTKMRDRGLKINSIGRSTRNGLVIAQADIDRLTSKPNDRKKKRR
ncbi:hypothetical protein B5S28_g403 [[Candida] boidinii]|nr:hypothetical protein B5S28_g403 [[Candida] boidinii]